jgi:hypothetical protein
MFSGNARNRFPPTTKFRKLSHSHNSSGISFKQFPCAHTPRNARKPPTLRGSARKRFPANPKRSIVVSFSNNDSGTSYKLLFDT